MLHISSLAILLFLLPIYVYLCIRWMQQILFITNAHNIVIKSSVSIAKRQWIREEFRWKIQIFISFKSKLLFSLLQRFLSNLFSNSVSNDTIDLQIQQNKQKKIKEFAAGWFFKSYSSIFTKTKQLQLATTTIKKNKWTSIFAYILK